ncbi:MAG TPA: DUF418 domain-containing protein [Puia sp.]|nr:DUF418 domain-containing protein [Puia sp.]
MESNPISPTSVAAPVSQSERIVIIDMLRGIALLGILLMNIPYFALPDPAADNLAVMKELGTINAKVWYAINFFFDGTQRAIFSMLFGAGVILFLTRLEKRVDGMTAAEYFMRRQLWLLVFGLFDAFILLWNGDILFDYAVCGTILFAFRRLPPKKLLIAAVISLVLMTARENVGLYRQKNIISKGEAIAKIDTTKTKLNEQQKEDLGALTGYKENLSVESMRKEMEKNMRQIRGDYGTIYTNISNSSARFEFIGSYYYIWDILVFMFFGMAFFKMGILTGEAPTKTYWLLFIIGLSIGLTLSYLRLKPLLHYQFNFYDINKNQKFELYEIARVFRSLGVFGLIILLYKSGIFNWLFKLLRPVGQMAFTNYLMQSALCGIFFYGIGFGMYGKLQRYQAYYVVGAVWVIEIIWSNIWLRYFRFGPLEWCWRSLTYWKKQPMKKI